MVTISKKYYYYFTGLVITPVADLYYFQDNSDYNFQDYEKYNFN